MLRWACVVACCSVILPGGEGIDGKRVRSSSGQRARGGRRRTLGQENLDHARPLAAQEVGSGERAVSAADDEAVDALLDQVQRGELAALLRADCREAVSDADTGTSDDGKGETHRPPSVPSR